MKSHAIAEENPMLHNLIPLHTLTSSLSQSEASRVKVSHLPDQQEASGAHEHSYFEILFIEENEGWHQTGDHKIWATPGDVFLIVPGEVHDPSGLEGTKNWSIMFEADVLTSGEFSPDVSSVLPDELLLLSFLPKSIGNGYFQVAAVDRPRWLARLRQLEYELHHQPHRLSETARVLLMLLLIDTARLVAPELRKCSFQSRPLLISVFHFIKTQYHQQISLCDVAKSVGRSSAYLTSFVRRETGQTVLSWIIECRIAEARRLLLVTNQSVQQIAAAVGYLDASHFIRQFRRVNGMPPQTWRQANRIDQIRE